MSNGKRDNNDERNTDTPRNINESDSGKDICQDSINNVSYRDRGNTVIDTVPPPPSNSSEKE